MANPITAYTHWLHTQWPSGRVEQEPLVNEDGSTNLPGVWVVGDLTGVPLLKFSADTGAKAVANLQQRGGFKPGKLSDGYDLAIIGAGVAGVSAAIEAKKAGLSFIVLESQEAFTTIKNFPAKKPIYTYPTEMVPAGEMRFQSDVKEALLEELRQQQEAQGIEPEYGEVDHVEVGGGRVKVVFKKNHRESIMAQQVIVAIGRTGNFRKLNVPGENYDFVSTRLIDAAEFSGKRTLVVGGGDSALEAAIALAESGSDVTLSYRRKTFQRPKPDNVERLNRLTAEGKLEMRLGTHLQEIDRDGTVTICGEDGCDLAVRSDNVFVLIGREPPLGFFRRSKLAVRGDWDWRKWLLLASFGALMVFLYHLKAYKTFLGIPETNLWQIFASNTWFPFGLPSWTGAPWLMGAVFAVLALPLLGLAGWGWFQAIFAAQASAKGRASHYPASLSFWRRQAPPAGAVLNRRAAALAHLSGWVTSFLGPLVAISLIKEPRARNEAKAAFNFQLTLLLGGALILPIGYVLGTVILELVGIASGASMENGLLTVALRTAATDPGWFFAFVYTVVIVVFGLRRIRRRRTPYITRQTLSLMAFQVIPLFLLPYVLFPWMGANGAFTSGGFGEWFGMTFLSNGPGTEPTAYWRAFGFILAWPLFIYNVFTEAPLWGWLILSLIQTFVIIPLIIFRWGKGAYCGWICSCGAMAETLGDKHRQKMPHGPRWNALNMVGQGILAVAFILLLLRIIGWLTPWDGFDQTVKALVDGNEFFSYKVIVDLWLAGAIGYGLYFHFSGRVWCRFACPLAALMHIYHRFSRFRIFADKKKCISCNACTTNCHQGIDIMNFANKGLPMEDPECVRCSACVQVCPTGTLSFGRYDGEGKPHLERLWASPVQRDEAEASATPIDRYFASAAERVH